MIRSSKRLGLDWELAGKRVHSLRGTVNHLCQAPGQGLSDKPRREQPKRLPMLVVSSARDSLPSHPLSSSPSCSFSACPHRAQGGVPVLARQVCNSSARAQGGAAGASAFFASGRIGGADGAAEHVAVAQEHLVLRAAGRR